MSAFSTLANFKQIELWFQDFIHSRTSGCFSTGIYEYNEHEHEHDQLFYWYFDCKSPGVRKYVEVAYTYYVIIREGFFIYPTEYYGPFCAPRLYSTFPTKRLIIIRTMDTGNCVTPNIAL